ncbi:anoctamin-10-like [Centroberyx gerrardi]
MATIRDGIRSGGGNTGRKDLLNTNIAASVLPLLRLNDVTSLVLLEFHPEVEADTVDWILGTFLAPEILGGADILGMVIGRTRAGGPMVVVGATPERLLLEVTLVEDLFRPRLRCTAPSVGGPRDRHHTDGLSGILSSAKCVTLLQRILSKLCVGEREEVQVFQRIHIPPGEAVIASLCCHGVITDSYPLHEASRQHSLKAGWCVGLKPFSNNEHLLWLEEIRDYFGERVALYFGFQGRLIHSLLLKAVLSVLLYFSPMNLGNGMVFFSLSNMVWSAVFLQGWEYKSKSLKRHWSTAVTQQPVQNQQSSLVSPPASSPQEAGAPRVSDPPPSPSPPPAQTHDDAFSFGEMHWKRLLHSLVFLTCTIFLSSCLILTYMLLDEEVRALLRTEDHLALYYNSVLYVPEVTLTLAMAGMDCVAYQLSNSLNPHRQQRQQSKLHQQHYLLPELIFSCLFNHFAVHVYTALVLRNFSELRYHLAVQLATHLTLKLLSAALLPCLGRRVRRVPPGRGYQESQLNESPIVKDILEQSTRPGSDSQTWSYLELLISYCHVMFFSCIYPQCALWCLFITVVKSRLDMWNLCDQERRAFPQMSFPAGGIGVWQRVFEVVETLAVLINLNLLWSSGEMTSTYWEVLKMYVLLLMLMLTLGGGINSLVLHLIQATDGQREEPGTRHARLPRRHPHQPSTQVM